ncbi:polyphosphate polymerase domain-containing protein [Breznakia sp. OttesenSCG-928-G09]|nr:polyphosphate polymerase domain-containing protein [Breznakia sp. OttesenSCG-928-G09]
MAKEVFGRHEAKYCLNEFQLKEFHKEINKYLELDQYNKDGNLYRIYNLYADTKDNNMIRTSLSKPKYKEKIRIRAYQEFKSDDLVFVEIKKKYNRFVNKRRTKMKFKDAVVFVETGELSEIHSYMNLQVIKELNYLISKEPLYLKTYLAYDRMAYFSKEQKDLRITFDTNIIAKRNNTDCVQLLEDGMWIMEIKAEQAFPLWLVKLLSKHKIYKQSFSKYGKEYEHYLRGIKYSDKNQIKEYEHILEEELQHAGNTFEFEY